MKRVYLAILFITISAFAVSGTLTNYSGNDFNEAQDNVKAYTQQTEQYFETGFIRIFGTAQNLVTTVRTVTDFLVNITSPLTDFSILDLEDPTVVCVDYQDLPLIQKINYESRRAFYNLFNSPNLDIEPYYLMTQIERYPEYLQVCV
jgi:hypothetical protein